MISVLVFGFILKKLYEQVYKSHKSGRTDNEQYHLQSYHRDNNNKRYGCAQGIDKAISNNTISLQLQRSSMIGAISPVHSIEAHNRRLYLRDF